MTGAGVLSVRQGRCPSCSATGSVVGVALLSMVAASAVINAFADRFSRWLAEPPREPRTGGDPREPVLRPEGDGALLRWHDPPAILRLDPGATTAALARGARPVGGSSAPTGAISAPIEVHVALTDRCPVACDTCYLDAGPNKDTDAHGPKLDADLQALARMGVFEVALGGGEALLDERAVGVVAQVAALGMTPNLTTSGFGLTEARAREIAAHVGQINVSWDGLGEVYRQVRGWNGEEVARRAIVRLREHGVRVGVNTVLTRHNVDSLDAFAEELVRLGVSEWQWLRLKPAGRAREAYEEHRLTREQALGLWPRLLAIEARTGLVMRVDCALVPFVVAHAPPVEALRALAVSGCRAGDELWSRTPDGRWAPCSFADPQSADLGPEQAWQTAPDLTAWRRHTSAPPAPCSTCAYVEVCRGGCGIVSAHLTGDRFAPDPECPRVLQEVA